MQNCTVSVAVRGSRNHVVANKPVTVAEIRVLQYLHGKEAISDVRPSFWDANCNQEEERARLKSIYGHDTDERQGPVGRLFGESGPLPTTLKQIGISPRDLAEAARAAAEEAARIAAEFETQAAMEDFEPSMAGFNEHEAAAFDDLAPVEGEPDAEAGVEVAPVAEETPSPAPKKRARANVEGLV